MIKRPANWGPWLRTVSASAGDFLSDLSNRPAASSQAVASIAELPLLGAGEQVAMDSFRERYESGMSASAGPRYWGFVTGGSTPAAIAGDWLTSTYDQNVSNDVGSVASSAEREAVVWLRQLFGLSSAFRGNFVSGATAANTTALASARQWVYAQHGLDIAEEGLAGAPCIPVWAGAAHSSIDKAMAILGWGRRNLHRLPTLAGRTAIDPDALADALAGTEGSSVVVASAGEVNTGDFDDLVRCAELCEQHGAWLHVDGAFGLFAALSPAHAERLRGINGAHSITVDLHKWLNVPYDSALVYNRYPEQQRAVYRASSAYLGDADDPLHYTPENSRRFRALPAWLSLAAYGRDGVAEWVQRNCRLAQRFGEGVSAIHGLELLSEVHLNIVSFAIQGDSDGGARDRLYQRLLDDGRVFVSPGQLFGRPSLRAALSNWQTQDADIELALDAVRDCLT